MVLESVVKALHTLTGVIFSFSWLITRLVRLTWGSAAGCHETLCTNKEDKCVICPSVVGVSKIIGETGRCRAESALRHRPEVIKITCVGVTQGLLSSGWSVVDKVIIGSSQALASAQSCVEVALCRLVNSVAVWPLCQQMAAVAAPRQEAATGWMGLSLVG